MATARTNWFTRTCRDVGLMLHNIRHPQRTRRQVVARNVTEKKQGCLTLRRTTIDEVEVREGPQ